MFRYFVFPGGHQNLLLKMRIQWKFCRFIRSFWVWDIQEITVIHCQCSWLLHLHYIYIVGCCTAPLKKGIGSVMMVLQAWRINPFVYYYCFTNTYCCFKQKFLTEPSIIMWLKLSLFLIGGPCTHRGTLWHSGWGTALQTRKSRDWFPMVSLGFFIDIILAALWPWGRLSLQQKWVPGIVPGVKSGQCVGLTTLPPLCADCLKIWEPQTPGTLRACQSL
jgi:hypothetical protein